MAGTTLTFAAPRTCESSGYMSAPATLLVLAALVLAWQCHGSGILLPTASILGAVGLTNSRLHLLTEELAGMVYCGDLVRGI